LLIQGRAYIAGVGLSGWKFDRLRFQNPLDHPSFSGCIPTLEQDQHFQIFVADPFLKFD